MKEYGVRHTTNNKTNACIGLPDKNFTLQNGHEILKQYFSEVQRLDYEDSLAVTNIEDILDYIYSLSSITCVEEMKREDLKEILEKKMVNGILNIPKEYSMFICRK